MGLKNKRGNHKADYDGAYARDKARSLIAVIENVFADMSCSGAVKCQGTADPVAGKKNRPLTAGAMATKEETGSPKEAPIGIKELVVAP